MIIICRNPTCGQFLRVPDDTRGVLKVRCPRCKTTFDWAAPGSKFEIREVALRCAVTGFKSTAVFARNRPTEKYRLRVVDPTNASVVERGKVWKAAQRARVQAEEESRKLAGKMGKGWLALVVGRGKQVATWAGAALAAEKSAGTIHAADPAGSATSNHGEPTFNTADFDWAGIWCPHCKVEGNPRWTLNGAQIILCGSCREIVCQGRVIDLPTGARTFRCHDGCVGAGEVLPPKEFDLCGKGVSLDPEERDQLLRRHKVIGDKKRPAIGGANRKVLPAPTHGGPGRQQ